MIAEDVRSALLPALARENDLPPGWDQALATYLTHLLERNRSLNLIARPAAGRVVEGQLLPSLAALLVVPGGVRLRVLDVGSGGGFPGIPLAVLRPEARVDLVEATGKKCEFLREATHELGLRNAHVHWCRIERPSAELLDRAPFDVLLARAVGSRDRVRDAAKRLLAAGGSAWCYVAPGEDPGDLVWPPTGIGPPVTALRRLA